MPELAHSFPFDPRYGYDEAALLRVGAPPAPEGFDAFWQETYRDTLAVLPRSEMRPSAKTSPGRDVFDIEFDSLGGFRVGGWLTVPRGMTPTRGFVLGHGYGGREGPEGLPYAPDAAAIFPCGRGFNRSAQPSVPGSAERHVIHGIASKATYLHRFCVADIWAAASALLEQFPTVRRLDYYGVSFGGGIGAMAIPWEKRFTRAYLDVPSFGNHPLRLTLPCIGSGESVRRYHQTHPEVQSTLRYFDSAIHATRARLPTLVAAALFDPAVPPPGQFAVYNALDGEKRLFVRQAAHFEWSGTAEEDRRVVAALREWFLP